MKNILMICCFVAASIFAIYPALAQGKGQGQGKGLISNNGFENGNGFSNGQGHLNGNSAVAEEYCWWNTTDVLMEKYSKEYRVLNLTEYREKGTVIFELMYKIKKVCWRVRVDIETKPCKIENETWVKMDCPGVIILPPKK